MGATGRTAAMMSVNWNGCLENEVNNVTTDRVGGGDLRRRG